jgi:hypothetical protein
MPSPRINGFTVSYTAVGAIILWSGIAGTTLSATFQDLLKGQVPQAAGENSSPAAAYITAPAPGEESWIDALLTAIGAPLTAANKNSIANWINHEGTYGTQGANNPLNTTYAPPGTQSSSFDGLAVKNFATSAQGLEATVTTLTNGNYGDILMLLRSGQGLCGHNLPGLSAWSGNGYSSVC